MNEMVVPVILENYFSELTSKFTAKSIPKCPFCKYEMKFEKFEPIFTTLGIGYIRKFRCVKCIDRKIILWRK